jgi:hypothetical protein
MAKAMVPFASLLDTAELHWPMQDNLLAGGVVSVVYYASIIVTKVLPR